MRPFLASFTLTAALVSSALAQEKITFQDHILPLVEANCAKCHNGDKKKGDLDLTGYAAALAGGASGKVVVPGDPEASKLIKVITHAEEPTMPPNRGKMADKEITAFKKWIAGGLLENLGSKALAGKPTVDLSVGAGAIGRPEGPPPMPGDLLLEPALTVKRGTAVTGLSASPWAPVIAVAGQKQIALYHSDTLDVLGVVPFKDEQGAYQPEDVKFSRNGKMLIVGGGHAAQAGRVSIFDLATGERIISVGSGQEFDSALGADLSPDQGKIALGGPSRLVKVLSTKDGSLLFKMKKHTDWVTAVAFSPNGEWLATADRNGGVVIWDADNGLEIHTLAGHKSAATALSWRLDSRVLASVSEDGSLKVWEMSEGKQVKTWNPHPTGVLSVSYTHDGRLVTCGRDNQVTAWGADGTRLKSFEFTNELPVRATFSHDGARVFASDWTGKVTAWETATGRRLAELAANPPSIAEQMTAAQQRLKELETGAVKAAPAATVETQRAEALKDWVKASNAVEKARAALAPKEAEDAKLKAEVIKNRTPELEAKRAVTKAARDQARTALTNALTALAAKTAQVSKGKGAAAVEARAVSPAEEMAAIKVRLAKLKAAQAYAGVHQLKESIADKKREQEKLMASGTKADKSAAEKIARQIAQDVKQLQKLTGDYEKLKSAAAGSSPAKQQARI